MPLSFKHSLSYSKMSVSPFKVWAISKLDLWATYFKYSAQIHRAVTTQGAGLYHTTPAQALCLTDTNHSCRLLFIGRHTDQVFTLEYEKNTIPWQTCIHVVRWKNRKQQTEAQTQKSHISFFLSLVCSPLCLSFHMQQLMKDKPRWLLFILVLLSSLALVFTISHFSTLDMSADAIPPGPDSSHLLSNAQFDCNACEKPNVTDSKLAWDACLNRGAVPEYYLSIVLVTRSDDYATDQRHRLQNMIDSTYILAMRTRMKIELLIIEWNPVIGRQRIKDIFRFVCVMRWSERACACIFIGTGIGRFRRSEYLEYRIISVPKKIHDTRLNVGNIPLHDYEGKNVGIRFARGEFVLCTNQG